MDWPGRTGSYAALLGATTPTNGDSSISQTFVAPAGAQLLSFFYKIVCNDTVAYDWATATLTDLTAATTSTVLAKTCSHNGKWTQALAAVTPGHLYQLTITNHDDDYWSDPTYTLIDDVQILVAAPTLAGALTNGNFEKGDASGWLVSGASATVVNWCHSGSSCVQLGSPNPTNGDSSLTQSFVAPAGVSTLSFSYRMNCPDSLAWDWATATLTDFSTNPFSTQPVLAKTCTTTGTSWLSASGAITPNHVYTLTLTSHDDNHGNDATYTVFDDVTLQ